MADDSNKWPNESPSVVPGESEDERKVESLFLGLGLFVCLHPWPERKGASARFENEFLGRLQLAASKQAKHRSATLL